MHYVSVEGLTKSYGINPLFNNISFNINEGDKIALIARNGVGKSTLLKILAGQETPDSGKFWINKEVTVALFEQDPIFDEDKTIVENIFKANHPIIKAIQKYELAMEAEDGMLISDSIMEMDDLGAWDFEAKVKQILGKLNIHHLQKKVNELSGGQRKRVALAKTLIDIGFEHQHTLLMMDEPTNHLDVEMIEWLEHYLNGENITLLLVTHDRYFLDAVCDEIWELERENMCRLGGKIVELKKVNKSYGELEILKGFDYTFSKGERVGVVGKNGIGKSTFLNIIQELETPTSGKVNVGDTVVFGNFSQTGLDVKQDFRVIEYVKSFAESFPLAKGGSISAAQFLELFLFPPDKQYTYLSSLSGGEKKRLHLLTILFRNPNFLILDEPTNDLDLPTLAVLESFLTEYQGCVMIVSHDRYFMDRLVDHLFVFEGGGFVRDFPGNYTQYRIWLKEQETAKANGTNSPAKAPATIEPAAPVAPATPKKKMTFKEKHEFEKLEKEMPVLEAEKVKLTAQMSNENLNYDQITTLAEALTKVTQSLEEMELRWLALSEMAE